MLSLLDSYSKIRTKENESMDILILKQRQEILGKELDAVSSAINKIEREQWSAGVRIERAEQGQDKKQEGGSRADSPGGIGGGGAGGTGEISKMGNGIAMQQTTNLQAMNQVHRAAHNLRDTLDDVLPMCNERREARLALRLVEMWAWEALTHMQAD